MSKLTESFNQKAFNSVNKWLNRHHLIANSKNIKKAVKALNKRGGKTWEVKGNDIGINESAAERKLLVGKVKTGGVLTFANVSADHSQLQLVYTLSYHAIESIEKIYFGDEEVVFSLPFTGQGQSQNAIGKYAGKVFAQSNLGRVRQSALSQLITDSGGLWTTNHRQYGCAHIYLRLTWDEKLFPSGAPDVSFLVKGYRTNGYSIPAPVPDNTDTFGNYSIPAGWTDNPAQLLFDLMVNPPWGIAEMGGGYVSNLYDAIKCCDELVAKADGTYEKRYTCNGEFSSSMPRMQIYQEILSSMGGIGIVFSYIDFGPQIFAAQAMRAEFTITESDIIGPINIDPNTSLRDSHRMVKGTYVEPSKGYEETDFPPYVPNESLLGGDYPFIGGKWEDIALPTTHSKTQAQRLAKIAHRRNIHNQVTFSCLLKLKWYILYPCFWVKVTLPRYGWNEKVFEVQTTKWAFVQDGTGGFFQAVEASFREIDEETFAWDKSEETVVASSSSLTLPAPDFTTGAGVTSIVLTSGNSTLFTNADGTIVPRILAQWTAPTNAMILVGGRIEIEFKKTSDANWTAAGTVLGSTTFFYIAGVQSGVEYQVRFTSVSTTNVRTTPVVSAAHTVTGKSSAPSNVSNFIGTVATTITFTWSAVQDSDVAYYQIRKSVSGQTWGNSSIIANVVGTTYGPITYDAAATYKIKAFNTSGIESTTERDHSLAGTVTTGKPLGLLLSLTKN